MKGKRAFELSATIIVILVISIAIFIGGIYFIKKFYSGAQEIGGEIESSTQQQIEALLREGGIVAIPLNKKIVPRGKGGVFGLGIRNVGSEGEFQVQVNFHKAFRPDGETPIDADPAFIDENWILYSEEPFTLAPNKFQLIPIVVSVGNEMGIRTATPMGTYIFNVCVYKEMTPSVCDAGFVENRIFDNLYSKKVYQIFVEIPS